jgi:hypothetical protein
VSEQVTAAKPRRGGWPKGKPRAAKTVEEVKAAADRAQTKPSLLSKMKSRPNWESEDFVGVGLDAVDRLKVPEDILHALYRDGVALQWVTRSVRGQETPQELSKMTRGGWTPVHQSDFDGILDGLFMPKGQDDAIGVDDCLLVARPVALHQKSRRAMDRDAALPLQISEEQIGRGIPGVTGSDHKTVNNRIKKTLERVEIPE